MEEYNSGRRIPKVATVEKNNDVVDKTYFYRVSILKYLAIVTGMGMLCFLTFHPSPETFLGKLGGPGFRLLYLRENYLTQLKIGFLVAVLLHIGEAWYAMNVASALNLTEVTVKKWTAQTAIVGYVSLQHLIKYKEEMTKAKRK